LGQTELQELANVLADSAMDDGQRENAASGLALLGDGAIVPLRQLLGTGDADQRWWSARTLAAIDSPTSVTLLIETLSDCDPDVRACAALSLGTLAAAEAVSPLVDCMADENIYVGRIAGNALIQIGKPAIPALIEALDSKSPATRGGAARALVAVPSHDAIPALISALSDESAIVTYYAQEALERLGVGMMFVKP
jgi:HEAT repeat protein